MVTIADDGRALRSTHFTTLSATTQARSTRARNLQKAQEKRYERVVVIRALASRRATRRGRTAAKTRACDNRDRLRRETFRERGG